MTPISKCDALALSVCIKTQEQMFAFAQDNDIPEMAEQAEAMTLSNIALRTSIFLTPVLFIASHCFTKPESMGEYAVTILAASNTVGSMYAFKRLYSTACYLQKALSQYPYLRASLLKVS